ncbi:MAG: hypothetical protein LBC46_02825 [Treponema sp.]|nr:hypothetical protein [Treponema sp.]
MGVRDVGARDGMSTEQFRVSETVVSETQWLTREVSDGGARDAVAYEVSDVGVRDVGARDVVSTEQYRVSDDGVRDGV